MTAITDSEKLALRALQGRSYLWTKDVVKTQIQRGTFANRITELAKAITTAGIIVPDLDTLARQLVTALDAGHVVLQGPPGTGKTSLARVLADVYKADLHQATATAEWSTYEVVGGLRPAIDGGFLPALGVVSRAVLSCAVGMADPNPQPTWLLIDEFNRADIDKAIGSMYTVLSSNAPSSLLRAPLELWFERDERRELWVPSAFRIIATMNDVDASYVNSMSQGLARRFRFVTLGVAVKRDEIELEVESAFEGAAARWAEISGIAAKPGRASFITDFVDAIAQVRDPAGAICWPVGTAQVVDVWYSLLVQTDGDISSAQIEDLDLSFADTVIHQAGNLSLEQLEGLVEVLNALGLSQASRATHHLANASSTRY